MVAWFLVGWLVATGGCGIVLLWLLLFVAVAAGVMVVVVAEGNVVSPVVVVAHFLLLLGVLGVAHRADAIWILVCDGSRQWQ